MSHTQQDDWNPLDASVLAHQREAFDGMRARCPLAHSQFLGWSLFGHADVAAVLDDPDTFSNPARFLAIPNGLNPPTHGPFNAAVATFFGMDRMRELEPSVRRIAVQLLDPLLSARDPEFAAEFIVPFIMRVQCAMLGWPEHQWEFLSDWVHGNQQVALSGDHAKGKALADRFSARVRANLDEHRANPGQSRSATGRLLRTEVAGQLLNDEQIVSILRNWVAGHGTAADGLSIVLMHLARMPALQERLRCEPEQIPAAIEELLRIDGPLVANRRTTTRSVELRGRTLPNGASLSLMWIAANRDPLAFEQPDTVILERDNSGSLTWGKGIHMCLGAPMARLEIRVALEELLARTGRIELADAAPPRKVYPGNGFASLRLRFR